MWLNLWTSFLKQGWGMAFTTIWFTQPICKKLISLMPFEKKSNHFCFQKCLFVNWLKTKIHGKKLSFKST